MSFYTGVLLYHAAPLHTQMVFFRIALGFLEKAPALPDRTKEKRGKNSRALHVSIRLPALRGSNNIVLSLIRHIRKGGKLLEYGGIKLNPGSLLPYWIGQDKKMSAIYLYFSIM